MESLPTTRPHELKSFDELSDEAKAAMHSGNFEALGEIVLEARARDRWDDTDPRYVHLIDDCQNAIKDIMVQYG